MGFLQVDECSQQIHRLKQSISGYYLLIGEMICLGHQNEVPMVSVLVCMVTY